MRKARVAVMGSPAGVLEEREPRGWTFRYDPEYCGHPVSLTMPVAQVKHVFDTFPPFFEGLLPEGDMLEGLLRLRKLDHRDYFAQLVAVGADTVGAVTIEEIVS